MSQAMVVSRRRFLQAGAGATCLPVGYLFAQDSRTTLLRARKEALVIGIGKYQDTPLRNAVNDARGIAEVLGKVGFNISLGLDLTHAELLNAIARFGGQLSKTKAVGFFYFAGHGAQLAWRNYLIPPDVQFANLDELRERAVDVNRVFEDMRRAANPMNLVILDACRDNPFGKNLRADQRGLSQIDAPPGTLLAYATAPGNTASDGEGQNGLYTEHLIKEMVVPEAKVEDVFKRVRLAVRRKSNGQQIPWESTSLEDDFWFVPPKELKKLAEDEIEREFKQERAMWEKIQHATQPEPVEEYLRRYPSGRFAELAQLRLDQVLAKAGEKKVEIASAPNNPYTKGTANANTNYRIGDTYTWRTLDSLTGVEQGKPFTRRVTQITDTEIIYNKGTHVTDLLGNRVRPGDGSTWSANQTVPLEFAVGKRWSTRFEYSSPTGRTSTVDLDLQVKGREKITVPAGTFDAFRIDANGWQRGQDINSNWRLSSWYAPEAVRREVAWAWANRAWGRIINSNRYELTAFKQS